MLRFRAAIFVAVLSVTAPAKVFGTEFSDECTHVAGTLLSHNDVATGLLDWIRQKTGWKDAEPARICLVPKRTLDAIASPDERSDENLTLRSLYSERSRTIFLENAWNPAELRDRSYLLHELVHHLQVTNQIEMRCAAAREAKAYELQLQWLREQGIDDPDQYINTDLFTIRVLSQCAD